MAQIEAFLKRLDTRDQRAADRQVLIIRAAHGIRSK